MESYDISQLTVSTVAGTELGCFACKASGLCLHVLSGWHNSLCKVVRRCTLASVGNDTPYI